MTTATGHTQAICAKKVIGTNVNDRSGKKLGQVEDVVLDKKSNNIMFAIVSFGGLLGMNAKYHPIPWASLDYDTSQNAYVVGFTREQLEAAPADSIEELTRNDGTAYRDRAYKYYDAPRYW
jgi:sporulation protein YlmC with PRC-barrel domain